MGGSRERLNPFPSPPYFVNQTTNYLCATQEIEVGVLVNFLILDAVHAKASDIHIEPWESSVAVRIRLNGVLNELVHLPMDLMDRIAGRLKVMANLVSYETGLPQEGRAPANPELDGVELRISIFPTVRGEKVVIRIFDPHNRSFELAKLGFEEEVLQTLYALLARPHGILLLTGPTGSGKTTAIYAALSHLVNKHGPAISISTVEDPVEFRLPFVSQTQINPLQEFTYPVALRSLMRQDPQVIMIGEIRDAETAAMAVRAGLTGHLVISTIHSGSAAGIFARLINMEIEPFLLASSIMAVLGLRLFRRNCAFCAQPYEPDPELIKTAAITRPEDAEFRRGAGCQHCLHTGFSGRSSLSELMVLNDAIRQAILEKAPTRSLQQTAIREGMQTLWQSGIQRAVTGQTSLEEILRVLTIDQF